MKSSVRQIFFGAALIIIGGLFLVQQIFQIPMHLGAVITATIFALAGCAFLYTMVDHRERWWAAIPGLVLVGLGALIATSAFFPDFASNFGGSLFLGSIALAFLVVYLMKHENWWAIIPAGVMATLALVAAMGSFNGMASGATFFLGIAITFGIIGMLPVGRKEKWPWIPAGICAVLGTMLMIGSGAFLNTWMGLIWPAILVLVGVYLIFRTFSKKSE